MTLTDVDIMMIGHFSKDKIVVDGTSETASGGAIFYGSIALRNINRSVAVVTRLHPDDFPYLDELKQEGIRVFTAAASETSSIENIYDSTDMERRTCKLLSFAGPFQEQDIPDLSAKVYLITGVIAGEVNLSLLKSLAVRGPVGLDVQGFVRVPEDGYLTFRQMPDIAEVLAHVTYLKVDRAEAELLTDKTDLRIAARQLAEYGPREVIITHSKGITVYADEQIYEASFWPRSLDGRTGRGDTCFATYVGRRLSDTPELAARFAAGVTTLKQEIPGPWRGTVEDVEELLSKRGR
jgi:sugar/nucleoside kinase (ribokinase family)